MLDYDGLLELVKKRRSIRKFKPDPVPDELINKVLEVARWAPSGANSQPWEFLVIKDKAVKEKVVPFVQDAMRYAQKWELTREKEMQHPSAGRPVEAAGFKDAPVLIFLLGDQRRRTACVLAAQEEPISYISGLSNAFLYMHLAATSLGLASQWLSASRQTLFQAQLKQELGVPPDLDIYDMFVLGYAAESPKPRVVRELKEMVHVNRYDKAKYQSDAQIRKFTREMQVGHGRAEPVAPR